MAQKEFTIVARKGLGGVTHDGSPLEFKSLTLARQKSLWEEGFKYLHITHEVAREQYADATPEVRARLIMDACKTVDEVDAMAQVRPVTDVVRKAAKERTLQLTTEAQGAPLAKPVAPPQEPETKQVPDAAEPVDGLPTQNNRSRSNRRDRTATKPVASEPEPTAGEAGGPQSQQD